MAVTRTGAQPVEAQRALVLHDRPLVVDLIELTLNHGMFLVRAVQTLPRRTTSSMTGTPSWSCWTWTTTTARPSSAGWEPRTS